MNSAQRFTSIVIASLAMTVLASPAAAQQGVAPARPEALTRLIGCRGVTDPTARLACYDAAAQALDSAEQQGDVVIVDRAQVSAARRQLFGFDLPALPNLFERGPAPERVDSIETTLTRASQVSDNRWVFTLADGSVWRQIDFERVSFQNRPGEQVRVRRAALGSYQLVVGRSRAVRVRRQ